ncbi:hypothetical protein ANCDUO_07596, partial [Ancylostoma duodenale]
MSIPVLAGIPRYLPDLDGKEEEGVELSPAQQQQLQQLTAAQITSLLGAPTKEGFEIIFCFFYGANTRKTILGLDQLPRILAARSTARRTM